MVPLFVFGSLKQGFCNFHHNRGVRVPGRFVTVQRFSLYIIGPENLPWLVTEATPGEGHAVVGELFEVDDAALADMDRLERVHEPLWYSRQAVAVRPAAGGAERSAWVYLGNRERMVLEPAHVGPVPEYTQALAAAFPLWPDP
jgi:gamma-glutamylaminecyclotransferase